MYMIKVRTLNSTLDYGWHSYQSMCQFVRDWDPKPGAFLTIEFAKIHVLQTELA